jgi:hypothetical protein
VAQRKDANYIERMQKRSREDEPTRRSEPYFPDRSDLTYGPETLGEACATLCDRRRRRRADEFADLRRAFINLKRGA